jgi:hypothetical protein
MSKEEIIKVILSTICLIAYTIPLISNSYQSDYEFVFEDFFYAVGTTLGIGGYLIVDSCKLDKTHKFYLISAGIFFVILSLIFIFDTISDREFRTYWYVVFNLLITFICCISLIYLRRRYSRH